VPNVPFDRLRNVLVRTSLPANSRLSFYLGKSNQPG